MSGANLAATALAAPSLPVGEELGAVHSSLAELDAIAASSEISPANTTNFNVNSMRMQARYYLLVKLMVVP